MNIAVTSVRDVLEQLDNGAFIKASVIRGIFRKALVARHHNDVKLLLEHHRTSQHIDLLKVIKFEVGSCSLPLMLPIEWALEMRKGMIYSDRIVTTFLSISLKTFDLGARKYVFFFEIIFFSSKNIF